MIDKISRTAPAVFEDFSTGNKWRNESGFIISLSLSFFFLFPPFCQINAELICSEFTDDRWLLCRIIQNYLDFRDLFCCQRCVILKHAQQTPWSPTMVGVRIQARCSIERAHRRWLSGFLSHHFKMVGYLIVFAPRNGARLTELRVLERNDFLPAASRRDAFGEGPDRPVILLIACRTRNRTLIRILTRRACVRP